MWKREPEVEYFILLSLVLVMTLLGTLASYAHKVLSGQRFHWQILLLQTFISIFAGALVLMAAFYYEWHPELAGGISGLAGWSGAGSIKSFEKALFHRMEDRNGSE